MSRIVLTLAGLCASFVWAVAFMRAPGAAMEVLLAASPIVVTAWLILMLTMRRHERRAAQGSVIPAVDSAAVRDRDGGCCRHCGAGGATVVVARRPVRKRDADHLQRFVTLCDRCAGESPLAAPARPR